MEPKVNKFVPVMITPFNQDLEIDWDALSEVIEFYLRSGAKGLFANCLSSEMYSITEKERIKLVHHIVTQAKGRVPVVATGSFGLSQEDKAESVKKIHATGVDAVILITSHFAKFEEGDGILVNNFEKLFDLTGNIPLGLYECPAPYKRIISAGVFGRLLESKRLIYHKDTSLKIDLVRKKLDVMSDQKNEELEFYDAHTPNALASLRAGARGLSAIAGNFYPELLAWLCAYANQPEQKEKAEWLQAELTHTDPLIHEGYPASSKYFLKNRGIRIKETSRVYPLELTTIQKKILDEIYLRFLGWCERLEISPFYL
jgi:4-hydroxy-tetrahydrodipicolinate synthase